MRTFSLDLGSVFFAANLGGSSRYLWMIPYINAKNAFKLHHESFSTFNFLICVTTFEFLGLKAHNMVNKVIWNRMYQCGTSAVKSNEAIWFDYRDS